MIIQSFYDVLRTTFENKGILTYSGFQDRTAIPYLFISKIISSLDTRDTFVNRHDTNLVQISYFSKYFSDFNDDLSTIRNLLLYKQLVVPNRRLLNIEELELVRSEPEKGLYQGIFQYEALTEKTLQNFEIKTIEAADLFEALYSRYTNSKLINNTSDFVTTQFGESAYPFLHVPNYEKTLKFGTTKSRIDNIIFSIDEFMALKTVAS